MVKLDDCVIAKLSKDSHHFEIFVEPYLAWDYKHGKEINFDDVFGMEEIYSDSAKGKTASQEVLKQVFGTEDFLEIAKKIIIDGEVQLTTAQRNQMLEKRKNDIINFIAKNANDPREKTPIPPQRIINALEEAKYKFNLSRRRDDEIKEVLLILKKIMPISLDKLEISIEVPASYSGKIMPILHKYNILEEKWMPNGSLFAKVAIPAGLKNNLISDFNNITKGEVTINVLKE